MKSGYYVAIFIAIVAVIGGLIWYTGQDVNNISSETVTAKLKKDIMDDAKKPDIVVVEQKTINVLLDKDFEADTTDISDTSDMEALDNIDTLLEVEDENITF